MQEVDLNHAHNELLIGFDLACEEFRLVQLPNEPVRSKWDYNLIVVRGCLSMVEVYLESPFVVMWLLKEDGKKNEFWSKFMKIPNQDYFYSEPLCFMRSGEVLLRITYEDRFFELILVNGSLYWVVHDDQIAGEDYNNLIIGFDLKEEQFRWVGLPRMGWPTSRPTIM
ncbi:hypothetical protein LguiA_001151 [Lonicera macranthoides]